MNIKEKTFSFQRKLMFTDIIGEDYDVTIAPNVSAIRLYYAVYGSEVLCTEKWVYWGYYHDLETKCQVMSKIRVWKRFALRCAVQDCILKKYRMHISDNLLDMIFHHVWWI
jgi:hypothetical protein